MATDRSHDLRPDPRLTEISRLRRLALRDELTGLANRRAFLQRLDADIARAQRRIAPFSLVLLDLDGLKDLNDTFGHRAGDEALRTFGRALRRAVRAEDLVARIGGDEFALVGGHGEPQEAPAFAARIGAVANGLVRRVAPRGQRVRISAAMGWATWDSEIPDAETLFARAESALLAAKHSREADPAASIGVFQPRGRKALGEELRHLLSMARHVSSAPELQELARAATEHAAALIGAREASIALPRADGLTGYDQRFVDGMWVSVPNRWYEPGRGVIGQVMATAEPLVVNGPHDDAVDDVSAPVPPGAEMVMCLPLRDHAGGALGVLSLANKRDARGFTDGDVQFGMAFADLAASAIENVRAREQEASAHLYLRTLMDQAHDAIYIVDPVTRRILDVNEAAQQMSGYTREQLLQMRALDLRPAADRAGPGTTDLVQESDGVLTMPRRHQRADGTLILVEVSARRIRTPRGEVVMNIVRDVGERVAAQQELLRRNRELEARNDVAALLAGADDDAAALGRMLEIVTRTIGVEGALLAQCHPDTGAMRVTADFNVPEPMRSYLVPRRYRAGEGFLGSALTGHTVVMPDAQTTDLAIPPETHASGIRSFAIVPMIARGRVIGVLAAGSREPQRFDDAAVAFQRAVADQVALWLEHRRLLAETRQRERDARFLSELGELLNSTADLDRLVGRLMRKTSEVLSKTVAVFLGDEGDAAWQMARVYHPSSSRRRGIARQLGAAPRRALGGLTELAARSAVPLLVDVDGADLPEATAHGLRGIGIRTVLIAPLRLGGRSLGLLAAGAGADEPPMGARHQALAAAIARHASIAVANALARRGAEDSAPSRQVRPRRDP